ncbi:MAG: SDR family NAD(P)-dependent oxidoreductase [Oligoflexales bacterium]
MSPNGKKVLISGASSGIGLATAHLMSEQGYHVVGLCRDVEKGYTFQKDLKRKKIFDLIECDFKDSISRDQAWLQIKEKISSVDILINNAGYGEMSTLEEASSQKSHELFEANYFGHVDFIQKALPYMRHQKNGIIINIGSVVYEAQFPFKAHYCAVKSALSSMTLSLRYEVAPLGIRVHLVEPGWVRSHFHQNIDIQKTQISDYENRMLALTDFSQDHNPRIPSCNKVAQIIIKTIQNKNSPARIPIGKDSAKARWIKRLLGYSALDKLILKRLAIKYRQTPCQNSTSYVSS